MKNQIFKFASLLFAFSAATVLTSCTNDLDDGGAPDSNASTQVQKLNVKATNANIATFVVPSGTKSVIVEYPSASGSRFVETPITPIDCHNANGTPTGFAKATLRFSSSKATSVNVYLSNGFDPVRSRAPKDKATELVLKNFTVSEGDAIVSISPQNVEQPVDKTFFLTNFKEGENHENASSKLQDFGQNFLYKSDGNGFNIYPVYSNGAYTWILGLFYYDKQGVKHDIDMWDTGTGWKQKTNEVAPVRASGIHVEIPEGYVYGFYVTSYMPVTSDYNEYLWKDSKNYYKGTFYSYKELNTCCGQKPTNCTSKTAHKHEKECHAITFSKDGRTYVGFEDSDHDKFGNSDRDFNDLIFWIDPCQKVVVGPNDAGEGGDVSEGGGDAIEEEIKKSTQEDEGTPEETTVVIPDDAVTTTTDSDDDGSYWHSSGTAFFDTDDVPNYTDVVLDYDIEGYLPSQSAMESSRGKWPYLKATIHVRCLNDTRVTGAGLDLEGLRSEYICETDDMYITVKGIDFEQPGLVASRENGEEKLTTRLTGLNNVALNDLDGELTFTVMVYPRPEDAENYPYAAWQQLMQELVCKVSHQRWCVTLSDGTTCYNCIKAPVLTKHPKDEYTLFEAYPELTEYLSSVGANNKDWYAHPVDEYLAPWW